MPVPFFGTPLYLFVPFLENRCTFFFLFGRACGSAKKRLVPFFKKKKVQTKSLSPKGFWCKKGACTFCTFFFQTHIYVRVRVRGRVLILYDLIIDIMNRVCMRT